jgi:hypothetical protein
MLLVRPVTYSTMNSALTKKSDNKKTGAIAVSTTSRKSCADGCPFLGDQGCYAESGYYTRMHWDQVTEGTRGVPPLEFIEQVSKLPANEMFRHNVAGDLWKHPDNSGQIYFPYLEKLAKASSHLYAAWTYTHHTLEGTDGDRNRQAIFDVEQYKFIVNISTESLDVAARLQKEGFMVTVVQPKGGPTAFRHQDVQFVQCPATLPGSEITCQTCGGRKGKPLCATIRKVVVVFPAHGGRASVAERHCS